MFLIGPTLSAQVESSAPIANYLVCCDLPTSPAPDLLYTGVELGSSPSRAYMKGGWAGKVEAVERGETSAQLPRLMLLGAHYT